MAAPKKGLGSKGLGIEALINNQMNDFNSRSKDGVIEIDINKIEPNASQPRRHFEEEALEELAESIREYGIIQPIIVKKVDDYYEIIAGERRWRAAKIAGIEKLPAIIRSYDISKAFEVALIENIQRENLNPIEEALSYKRLAEELKLNQEEIAQRVGKKRSTITNSLRLLHLDGRVQNFIIEDKLTNGHAKVLLAIEDKEKQFELAEKVIEDGLSVRATEELVKAEIEKREKTEKDQKIQNSQRIFDTEGYKSIENDLKCIFGTKVKLNAKKNKGKIEIEYYSDEDLDRLLGIMKNLDR